MSSRAWTYAEYAALPEDGRRFELIEGSLVEMPAPSKLHQRTSATFFSAVSIALTGMKFEVFFAPLDVVLGSEDLNSSRIVVQPDLMVLPIGPSSRCHLGSPPWVLEIMSPSSRHYDQVVKHRIYEKYGVGEYWLVDITQRVLTAYRRAGNVFLPGLVCNFDRPVAIESLGVLVNLKGVAGRLALQDAIDEGVTE